MPSPINLSMVPWWALMIASIVLRERGYPADVEIADLRQQAMEVLIASIERLDGRPGAGQACHLLARLWLFHLVRPHTPHKASRNPSHLPTALYPHALAAYQASLARYLLGLVSVLHRLVPIHQVRTATSRTLSTI